MMDRLEARLEQRWGLVLPEVSRVTRVILAYRGRLPIGVAACGLPCENNGASKKSDPCLARHQFRASTHLYDARL